MTRLLVLLVATATSLTACDLGPAPPQPRDAGPRDAGPRDAGPRDAGSDVDARAVAPWPYVDPFVVEARPTAIRLRDGATAALVVMVLRAPGFEEPVEVSAWGLPRGVAIEPAIAPPGVEVIALRVAAEQGASTNGPVPFALAASAAGVRHSLRLTVEVAP